MYLFAGTEHTAFDINGRDGVVQQDLREQIDPSYYGKFDVVTNFGTSEHVGKRQIHQAMCFANIHNLCRVEGVMVHYLPASGYCNGHGRFKYTPDFFNALALENDYRVFESSLLRKRHRAGRGNPRAVDYYVGAILRKRSATVFSETFPQVPLE